LQVASYVFGKIVTRFGNIRAPCCKLNIVSEKTRLTFSNEVGNPVNKAVRYIKQSTLFKLSLTLWEFK
jgi:hypothetical protein